MNEELQKALSDVINKASSGIDAASGFIMAELPGVVQQALTWYFIESLIFSIAGVLLLLFSYKAVKIQYKLLCSDDGNLRSWADDSYGVNPVAVFYCLGAAGIDIFMFIFSATNVLSFTWLKIWVAPKIWLIEYATKLTG